jgi:hypothetical protein
VNTKKSADRRPVIASVVIVFSLLVAFAITGFGVTGVVTEARHGGSGVMAVIAGVGLSATGLCARLARRRPECWSPAVWCGLTAIAALVATFGLLVVTVGMALQRVMS